MKLMKLIEPVGNINLINVEEERKNVKWSESLITRVAFIVFYVRKRVNQWFARDNNNCGLSARCYDRLI